MKSNKLSMLALVAVLLGAGLMVSAPKATASDGGDDFKKEVRIKVDRDFGNGLSAAAIHNLLASQGLGMMAGHGLGMLPANSFGLLGDNDFRKEVRIKVERDNDNFGLLGDNNFKKEIRIKVDNDRDFDLD